jgi:hypothetical protein
MLVGLIFVVIRLVKIIYGLVFIIRGMWLECGFGA